MDRRVAEGDVGQAGVEGDARRHLGRAADREQPAVGVRDAGRAQAVAGRGRVIADAGTQGGLVADGVVQADGAGGDVLVVLMDDVAAVRIFDGDGLELGPADAVDLGVQGQLVVDGVTDRGRGEPRRVEAGRAARRDAVRSQRTGQDDVHIAVQFVLDLGAVGQAEIPRAFVDLGADVPAEVPAVAFQRGGAVGQQRRDRRHGRGQLGLDVLRVQPGADVQPVVDLIGQGQAGVARAQLRGQGVIAGEGALLVFGGEVVGGRHRDAQGEAIADRCGEGEVRHQAAFDRVDLGIARVDHRHVHAARIGDVGACIAHFGIDLDGVQADGEFAAAAGDGGGVPPQRADAAIGGLAGEGASGAAHGLFLQIEGACEGRGRHARHQDGGQSQAAEAGHVPGGHLRFTYVVGRPLKKADGLGSGRAATLFITASVS